MSTPERRGNYLARRRLPARRFTRRGFLIGSAATTAALLAPYAHYRYAWSAPSPGEVSGQVSVWYFPFGPDVETFYQTFRTEFERQHPTAKINLQLLSWSNRYPKMLTAIAGGQGPDVMWMTVDAMVGFVEGNALVPLNDLLPSDIWATYPPKTRDLISYNGKRWYLPIAQEVPIWMYNKALLGKIGWNPSKPPATWDDMRQLCTATKVLGQDLFGWGYNAASPTLNSTFYPFLYQAGGRPISPDGRKSTFNSPAGVEALTFIVELFEKGWTSPAYLTPIDNDLQDPFFQRKQVVSKMYNQDTILDARQNAKDLDFGLTPTLRYREAWGQGSLGSWAISSTAKSKAAAAAWIAFLAQPQNMLKHSELSGEIPANPTVARDAYKNDPVFQNLAGEVVHTFDEQKIKQGRALMPLVIPEIQAAILKRKSPKQALDDAAQRVDALLAK
jgi:multiple sugar transport system substrate-binding protein